MSSDRSIVNNANVHRHIQEALGRANPTTHLSMASYEWLVDAGDVVWGVRRLPWSRPDKQPCNALVSECIQPFAESERHNLIGLFCREEFKAKIESKRSDRDCFVRVYLGRQSRSSQPSQFFTPHNPLQVDQMRALVMPVKDDARTMAEELAIIY